MNVHSVCSHRRVHPPGGWSGRERHARRCATTRRPVRSNPTACRAGARHPCHNPAGKTTASLEKKLGERLMLRSEVAAHMAAGVSPRFSCHGLCDASRMPGWASRSSAGWDSIAGRTSTTTRRHPPTRSAAGAARGWVQAGLPSGRSGGPSPHPGWPRCPWKKTGDRGAGARCAPCLKRIGLGRPE